MRPEAFRTLGGPPRAGVGKFVLRAVVHSSVGVALICLARTVRPTSGDGSPLWYVASALLLTGVGLVFHFGILTLLAAGWRLLGVSADELHRRPTAARSLTEFWGRRWNLTYAELSARAVYRPLRSRVGDSAAVFIAFVVSGVLHELAVSVPVRAGYGGPLAYFLLHGGLVLAERWLRPDRWGFAGRVWTVAWIIVPLPLLFHAHFLNDIAWAMVA
jgi:alginate O-acetyltransferase complex protein AlgI